MQTKGRTPEQIKIDSQIGNRVAHARRRAKLTQAQLAEMIDVSVQFLSDVERGKVGMTRFTIINLAEALGESIDFILMGKQVYPREVEERASRIQYNLIRLPEKERNLVELIINALFKYFMSK